MLTGKDIHKASVDVGAVTTGTPWNEMKSATRDMYNALSDKLNVQIGKAEEEANRTIYSAADIAKILPFVIKGLRKICEYPEQEYAEEMATSYLTDVLDLLSDILPDDIQSLVRQILSLYEQATKGE